MKKKIRWITENIEAVFLIIIMAYFAIATFTQVLCRFIFKISVPWTEESARYALIWMVFLGCSLAAKNVSHIRIDILESYMDPSKKWIFKQIAMLIFLVFALAMTAAGVGICKDMIVHPKTSAVLKLNISTLKSLELYKKMVIWLELWNKIHLRTVKPHINQHSFHSDEYEGASSTDIS